MTQGSLMNSIYLSTYVSGFEIGTGKDIICSPIPFFHIYGYSTGILEALVSKGTKVFPFFFPETSTTLKALEKFRCTLIRGTPTQYFDLLNHPERKKHDLSSLKTTVVAGSTVPSDLLKKLIEELKVDNIFVGYGMTETSCCHSQSTIVDKYKDERQAYQSCGRPLPWTESKIVDPTTGEIQPLNTDGELHVRGPHLIKKYWDDPEKTADSIDKNKWYESNNTVNPAQDKDNKKNLNFFDFTFNKVKNWRYIFDG